MVTLGLTGVVQAAATVPAHATSACASTAFDDTFTSDRALSSCWQTGTPLISSFAAKIGGTSTPPQLSFFGGMNMAGAAGVNQFSAVQSAAAYSAPFTFSVTALPLGDGDMPFSFGSGVGIYLVNSSLSQAFSVEGNFNPDAGSDYGIWANDGLTADGTGKDVYARPTALNPYEITMSVDSSGNATVSVTIPFESGTGTQYSIGNVGTGPFYLMLGQDEGTPNAKVLADQASSPESANLTEWESAKLNYCSTTALADDFSADQALSNCWETGTQEIGTVASDLGDSAVPLQLRFGNNFGPQYGNYLDMQGADSNNQFGAIQSANAYQAPFQFDTTVTDLNSVHADTSWGIWLVNSTTPSDTFSLQMKDDGLDADYGLYASNRLADAPSAYSTLLSAAPPGGTYSVAMTIDSAGNASVSLSDASDGTTIELGDFSVGNVGLGPFYVLLGQEEGSPKQAQYTGFTEAGWFSADLSPDYCSPQGSGTFYDDFAADTSLNSDCWSTSGPVISQLDDTFGNLEASYSDPALSFINGMAMTSGGQGGPDFSGLQSTYAYMAPFNFETTVTGTASADSAFAVYLVGGVDGGDGSAMGVEGNLNPANGADYGIWDNQQGIPAGNGFSGSEDLLAAPSEGTPYDISISVNAAGDASVEVNGVTSATHADVGTGPYYVFLGQRDLSGDSETAPANDATWATASLTTGVSTSSFSTTSPTVAGVESVPASGLPVSTASGATTGSAGDAASAPLSSIPLASSPLSSIPLSSIPLSSIAVPGAGDTAVAAAQAALSSMLLSDLSVTYPPGCGLAPATPCTGWAGILAGTPYENSPLEAVTLEEVLSNSTALANLDSVDLGALGLASSPLSSIPLSSIPLSSIPLSSIPLPGASAGASGALTSWCAELQNLNFACSSFGINDSSSGPDDNGVTMLTLELAGVPLSSIPLSSIPLSSIPLSSINLSSSPLSSIPLSSISLASNPLSSIPLSSITLTSTPLSSIPLSSIPLSSIPLSSIPLSSIPLSSIPLSSIPLSSIPLSSIPLSSIPLSSISNLPAVVDCSSYGQCASATLGQAAQAGAILAGADLGDLGTYGSTTLGDLPASAIAATVPQTTLGELGTYGTTTLGDLTTYDGLTLGELLQELDTSAPGFPAVTLGDLLLSMVPPASFPWQSFTLSGLPLAADETPGKGGTATYTASFTVPSPGIQQISADLPSTFAYVPGTTTVDGAAAPDPSDGPAGADALTWALPLTEGTHVLEFQANAGIGLGSANATFSINGQSSPATAPVAVVDGEDPAVSSQTTALTMTAGTPPFTSGSLNIGYLTSPGDVNDWSVQVAQGEELSVALTNLPATYDLELFGPAPQQLQGTPSQDLPGVSDTLPSLAPASTTEPSTGSQDIPITPPAGDSLQAISNNPDSQDQYIQTPPLAPGTYTVQVSGYNGAYSSQPYLLRANLLTGSTAPSCGPIQYPGSMPAAATGPVTIPQGVNTLFLVDTQRLSAAFGSVAEQTIMARVQAVASDSPAGVTGAIVPVDSYAGVQTAYGLWNSNPCSVTAANDVVTAISAVVDQIQRDNPTVQNLVIVGADDQIPFARLADGATDSNERDYGASTFAGENNVEADALSLGYYFSDDPYASPQPLGVGSATLYTPQLAVGRLVESATEIEAALTRFVNSNGNLDATADLTTGYSFLTSGADAVSANLKANGLTAQTLINENWSEGDLDTALVATPTPALDSVNAHFDYSRALPADDNASGEDTNLFTTTDIRNSLSSFGGRLLFSMGCHSGLDIDDAEVGPDIGATGPIDDWAKTFADAGALWVGNTGYGYADTDTIAYSAKLMTDFAANLNSTLTIGEALSEAEQQYAAGNAILSPYDLKALMESTLYGLPMYNLNHAGTPVPPPGGPPTTVVNGSTGLTSLSSPVSVNLTQGTGAGQLSLVQTTNGSYYQVNGTTAYNPGTQATEYRPIEPLIASPVTEPGLTPHGALVTALSSSDSPDPTPAYSLPTAGSANANPPLVGDAAFPGTLQRVSTYGTFTATGTGAAAQLDLVAGQFLPSSTAPGTGTERLFNSIAAQVYYLPPTSPYAADFTPPTIGSTQSSVSPSAATFTVQVSPAVAPVTEVLVLYTDGVNPGKWTAVNLTSSNGQTWTGSGAPTPSGQVQYIVQALDGAGNVAVSNNEGTAFNASPQPVVAIGLAGTGPVNGFYTGTVTVDITAPSGSTYVLDGSTPTPVPQNGTLTVIGSGQHTVTVNGPSGSNATATESFAISTNQTTTALSASPTSAVIGQTVDLTASVGAASSGAGAPGGEVEFFDGSTPIAACGGQSGLVIGAKGTAQCPVNYNSAGTHEISASYLPNGSFAGSASNPLGLVISPRLAKVTALSVSGSPAKYGSETNLAFSATVTASDSDPFPGGDALTIAVGTTTICTMTLTPGTGGASNSGLGECSPTSNTVLIAGTSELSGTFNATGADPSFEATAPGTVQVVVGQAPPTVSWPTPTPITFGTKLSSAQLDATASLPGSFAYNPPAGTVLQPGTQTLNATFTPSNSTDYASGTASTTISVGFTQPCITSSYNSSLIVAKGQVVCIGSGGKVNGSVSVASGGALYVNGGSITGSVSSSGALAITFCGTALSGSVSISNTSGPVTIGGAGCAGNTVGGSMALAGNSGTISLQNNHITGSLAVASNTGGVSVTGNTITGSASLTNNSGAFTYSGNTVRGSVVISGNS
jgi:Bacterial Ig-like domain (group 3)